MYTKLLSLSNETVQCYKQQWHAEPIIINKKSLLKERALLRYSFKLFHQQQSKDAARKLAKQLNKLSPEHIITQPYLELSISDIEKTVRDLAHEIAAKTTNPTQRTELLINLFMLNAVIGHHYNALLSPVGVNAFEKTVVPFLVGRYINEPLVLNMPIFRHEVQAKEFDGIVLGNSGVLIEEKVVLRKQDIRNIFSCEEHRKPSHLAICADPIIRKQNDLPHIKTIHLVFSELDHTIQGSKRLKTLHILKNGLSLEIPSDTFISLCESEVQLPHTKKVLRNCGIQNIVLTRLDKNKNDVSRYMLYHQWHQTNPPIFE